MQLTEVDPNKVEHPSIVYPNLFMYVLLIYHPHLHQNCKASSLENNWHTYIHMLLAQNI